MATVTQLRNSRTLLKSLIKPYSLSVSVALLFSLCLGLISAVIVGLIGPGIQVLVSPDPTGIITLEELVGSHISSFLFWLTGVKEFPAATFLNQLAPFLFFLATLKAIFLFSQYYLWEYTKERISRDLRQQFMDYYLGEASHYRGHIEHEKLSQNLSSLICTDIRLLGEYFVCFYGGMPRDGLQVIFLGVSLFFLSPKLFLIFFIGVIPALVAIRKLGKKIWQRSKVALDDYSDLTEWLQQRLLGVETIKQYQTEALEIKSMESLTTRLYHKFTKAARVKSRTSPILEIIAALFLVVVLLVALTDISQGSLTGAVAMSFFTTLAYLTKSVANLGRYFNSNREGYAAIDRLSKAFQKPRHFSSPTYRRFSKEIRTSTLVECKQLQLTYPGKDQKILDNLNYLFETGKFYCIWGPSGVGKTSLLKVLLGIQPPNQGTITFSSGVISPSDIGYIPQQVELFPGTIAENISYPLDPSDPDKIKESIQWVGLTTVVQNLTDGLETLVGAEKNRTLSGGQSQRILLARLFYHQFPLIIMDEGTSALDPQNEILIYKLLKHLQSRGSTIIVSTHRRAAKSFADTNLYFRHGALLS